MIYTFIFNCIIIYQNVRNYLMTNGRGVSFALWDKKKKRSIDRYLS